MWATLLNSSKERPMNTETQDNSTRSLARPAGRGSECLARGFVSSPSDHAGPVDICAYLLKICGQCQREVLTARDITCFFDVDSGKLSAWRRDIIGQIVLRLIDEALYNAPTIGRGGRITVSLRRTGQSWVLTVMDENVRTFDSGDLAARDSPVQKLALWLKGTSLSRLTRYGAITTVTFSVRPWWFDQSEGAVSLASPLLIEHRET